MYLLKDVEENWLYTPQILLIYSYKLSALKDLKWSRLNLARGRGLYSTIMLTTVNGMEYSRNLIPKLAI